MPLSRIKYHRDAPDTVETLVLLNDLLNINESFQICKKVFTIFQFHSKVKNCHSCHSLVKKLAHSPFFRIFFLLFLPLHSIRKKCRRSRRSILCEKMSPFSPCRAGPCGFFKNKYPPCRAVRK